jgi:hypothetical protein
MKSTPPLVTVARVAFSRFATSKSSLMDGLRGIRAFDTRVSTLLSSITVFSDSIQIVSTIPSRIIHLMGYLDL